MALQLCLDTPSSLQNPKRNKQNVFSRRSCTKFDRCDGTLSWANIQSSHLTSFLIRGNNCFLMFLIILFIYFNTIFIHKKRLRSAVPRACSGKHNFSWHLICERKQVLIWNIRFFSFPYTRSFYKLTGTSRVKPFSSCHTVFSIKRVLHSNFVTDLGRPEHSFLFIVPLTLKRFKSLFTDV